MVALEKKKEKKTQRSKMDNLTLRKHNLNIKYVISTRLRIEHTKYIHCYLGLCAKKTQPHEKIIWLDKQKIKKK